jgi:hypothetical protein
MRKNVKEIERGKLWEKMMKKLFVVWIVNKLKSLFIILARSKKIYFTYFIEDKK